MFTYKCVSCVEFSGFTPSDPKCCCQVLVVSSVLLYITHTVMNWMYKMLLKLTIALCFTGIRGSQPRSPRGGKKHRDFSRGWLKDYVCSMYKKKLSKAAERSPEAGEKRRSCSWRDFEEGTGRRKKMKWKNMKAQVSDRRRSQLQSFNIMNHFFVCSLRGYMCFHL